MNIFFRIFAPSKNVNMKKLSLLLLFCCLFAWSRADEGMWLPIFLNYNEAEMQQLGFKLTAEDVYSVNHHSMKDAIVLFGGGCTAEDTLRRIVRHGGGQIALPTPILPCSNEVRQAVPDTGVKCIATIDKGIRQFLPRRCFFIFICIGT